MRSPRHKVSSVLQLKFQFAAWLLLAPLLPAQDSYQQAVAAFREARVEEAIVLLEKLPADEANRPPPHNLKAVALVQLGRYEEAMAANRLAQQLDPSNANYAYNGGLILLNKKDFPQAEQAFRRAIGRFPQAAALRQGLGETLIELERYQEAERTLRDAVRVEPSSNFDVDRLLLDEVTQLLVADCKAIKDLYGIFRLRHYSFSTQAESSG